MSVETARPALIAARDILVKFRTMMAPGQSDDLDPPLAVAARGEMASFAGGIAAERAAITKLWPNVRPEDRSDVGQGIGHRAPECPGVPVAEGRA